MPGLLSAEAARRRRRPSTGCRRPTSARVRPSSHGFRAACGLALLIGAQAREHSASAKPAAVSCKPANPQDSIMEQCNSWCKADREHAQHCTVRAHAPASQPCRLLLPAASSLALVPRAQFCKCKGCAICGGEVRWPPRPPPNPSPPPPPPFCASTAEGDSTYTMCEPWCIREFATEHCDHCKCRGCKFCGPSSPPRPFPPPPPPGTPPPPLDACTPVLAQDWASWNALQEDFARLQI